MFFTAATRQGLRRRGGLDWDDPRLAAYAPTDPRAARLAAGALTRTGRAQQARDLLTLATSDPTARTGTGAVRCAHCDGL